MKDFIELIGELFCLVLSLLAIVGIIIIGKKEIDRWIDGWELSAELNFYFLSLYSLIAAVLGGVIWYGLNRVNDWHQIFGPSPYVGGTIEPHGIAAIIWLVATNTPVISTLCILGWKYLGWEDDSTERWHQFVLYSVFLLGIIGGSWIFYNLPLDKSGLRNYLTSLNVFSPFFKECVLALLWSFLTSFFGFFSFGLVKFIAFERRGFKILLKQTGLSIGLTALLTTLSVFCFLLAFTDPLSGQSGFAIARGILAGLTLRMTLFLGLLVSTNKMNAGPLTSSANELS